jgi:polysaccharide biosynthesis PFTS motif protein
MRGYYRLKREDRLHLVDEIKDSLSKNNSYRNSNSLNYKFINNITFPHNSIKQFYFFKVVFPIKLNKAILSAYGAGLGLSFPIPFSWQESVISKGIRVNRLRSSIKWILLVLKFWLRGIFIFFREIKDNLLLKNIIVEKEKHIRFFGLVSNNFPLKSDKSYDTLSWFLNFKQDDAVNTILHNTSEVENYNHEGVKILFTKSVIPKIRSKYLFIKFIIFGIHCIGYSLFKLLIGRWEYSFMLGELIKSLKMQYINRIDLSMVYMFNNSETIYRPLWTYVAESRGSEVQFYFYSSNISTFKQKSKPAPLLSNNWSLATWPNYLVWDQYQKDLIAKEVNYGNMEIVGPIWGADCNKKITKQAIDGIAIFDIQPRRDSIYQYLAMQNEYYLPNIVCMFLEDIREALESTGASMVLKQKRNVDDTIVHKQYIKYIKSIKDKIVIIEPCISAIRIINTCQAVISLPFTSTAILGIKSGKPSIYYDPTSAISKDDKAAHGIKVISGKNELQQWVNQTIN